MGGTVLFAIAISLNIYQVLDFLHVHFVPVEPINEAIGLCEIGYRCPKHF